MRISGKNSKGIVALLLGLLLSVAVQFAPVPANAQTTNLDTLFEELKKPDLKDWKKVEK